MNEREQPLPRGTKKVGRSVENPRFVCNCGAFLLLLSDQSIRNNLFQTSHTMQISMLSIGSGRAENTMERGAEFIPDPELTVRSLRIHWGVRYSLPIPRSIPVAIPTLSSKLQFSQQCSMLPLPSSEGGKGSEGWWVRRRMQYQVCLPNCNLARRRKRDVIGLIGKTNRVR